MLLLNIKKELLPIKFKRNIFDFIIDLVEKQMWLESAAYIFTVVNDDTEHLTQFAHVYCLSNSLRTQKTTGCSNVMTFIYIKLNEI